MARSYTTDTECPDELIDRVTGLPAAVIQRVHLRFALERAGRSTAQVGLVLIDLDDFAALDDEWGWGLGDIVLREVGERIRSTLRQDDVVVRLDGDLFVIVCEGLRSRTDMGGLVRRVEKVLAEPWEVCGHEIDLHISVGTAMSPGTGSPGELLIAAETAMAKARLTSATESVEA
jgi:diguanylate cyclase (GGDEF)-like protein